MRYSAESAVKEELFLHRSMEFLKNYLQDEWAKIMGNEMRLFWIIFYKFSFLAKDKSCILECNYSTTHISIFYKLANWFFPCCYQQMFNIFPSYFCHPEMLKRVILKRCREFSIVNRMQCKMLNTRKLLRLLEKLIKSHFLVRDAQLFQIWLLWRGIFKMIADR